VSFTPTLERVRTASPAHMFLSKPLKPPCSVFGPLLASSGYVTPSSVNRAPPMRLP
jgi:hypothetical protein